MIKIHIQNFESTGCQPVKRKGASAWSDSITGKIENEEMLKDLLDLQIDFGQGYLFGAPKAATASNR